VGEYWNVWKGVANNTFTSSIELHSIINSTDPLIRTINFPHHAKSGYLACSHVDYVCPLHIQYVSNRVLFRAYAPANHS